jgi:hypothetical protein
MNLRIVLLNSIGTQFFIPPGTEQPVYLEIPDEFYPDEYRILVYDFKEDKARKVITGGYAFFKKTTILCKYPEYSDAIEYWYDRYETEFENIT